MSLVLLATLGLAAGCKTGDKASELNIGFAPSEQTLPYDQPILGTFNPEIFGLIRGLTDKESVCFGETYNHRAQKKQATVYFCDRAPYWESALHLDMEREGDDPNWYLVHLFMEGKTATGERLEVGVATFDAAKGRLHLDRLCSLSFDDKCALDVINNKFDLAPIYPDPSENN